MIYELRTYTIIPGKLPEYMGHHVEKGRPIRGDNFGKLEGGWTTEIGPLNQYVHLWSFEGPAERERLRAELSKNERWTKEYVPLTHPLVIRQENKLLTLAPGATLKPPSGGKHIYEMRTYLTKTGKTAEWARLFVGALPVREKYSKLAGVWTSDVGAVQEVNHLWYYNDLSHRAAVRGEVMGDPGWREYLAAATPLINDMRTTIMLPTPTSPMQ